MIPKAHQNSPKCIHVGSKNEALEGYPIGFSAEIRWGTPPGVGFSILYNVEARYARLLWGKCGQHGSKLPSKMDPKSMKNLSKNRSKNWCILGSIFHGILMKFRKESGGKLVPKSMKNRYDLQKADFLEIVVCPQEKPLFFKNPLFANHIDFSSILVPTYLRFPSQNPLKSPEKSIPRCINFWIDFWIDFSSIWVRFWRATWSHVGHIFFTRAVHNGPQHGTK